MIDDLPSDVLMGVDFGSRYSGTSVIAVYESAKVYFLGCRKSEDSDEFIFQSALHFKPDVLFLDAPLSLPGLYRGLSGCTDYFYRKADLLAGAMSPMFLGGLTARAIRLRDRLHQFGISVLETYPKLLAHELSLTSHGYKQGKIELAICRRLLCCMFNPKIYIEEDQIKTWHHLDALLSLMSAMKFVCNQATTYGDEEEGLIIF